MATVSVVVPVYNVAPYLRQCMDSIVGQTLKELEIICVDDGSTDKSPAILQEYTERDNRIQIIRQENAGPGVARNIGMEQASGEYLIFLDSDDWFEPDFLEQMVLRAQATDADVVICKAVEFDTNTGKELPSDWMMKTQHLPGDTFSPEQIATHLFQFTYGMPWDKLYRRQYLEKSGIIFPKLKNSEDLAFVFPSLLAAERIAILKSVMVHHRVNRNSSVSNSRTLQPDAPYKAFQIVRTYLEHNDQTEIFHRSFLNWAMEFLVWHVSNISDPKTQKEYFVVLREKWIPELNFEQYPASYYENKMNCSKYLLARHAPFWLFSAIVRCYKGAKNVLKHM